MMRRLPCPMSLAGLVLAACAAPAVPAAALSPPAGELHSIELYATTDLHGHLEPSRVRGQGGAHAHFYERGGLALLGGFIKNARAHYPGRVLLLDGGDLFQGTLASNLTEGAAMIRGLNAMGYAAAALGNHEFDYGPVGPATSPRAPGDDPLGALRARMREARFPILAANVHETPDAALSPSYLVTELDGVRIGIVGGTSESLPQTTNRENVRQLRVVDLAASLLEAAGETSARGARLTVAVVHAGGECRRALRAIRSDETTWHGVEGCLESSEVFALAHALAAAAQRGGPRIHAVIGGHTHQPITAVVDGIPIIQSGKNGQYLSHLSLEVAGRGPTASPTGRFQIEHPIEVCSRWGTKGRCAAVDESGARQPEYFGPVTPDAGVEAAIRDDLVRAHEMAARPVGINLPEGLAAAYGEECPLGNLVAEAVRKAGGAEVGFVNGGGLRADLPPGELTYGALYESFPFDNEVVTIEMTGAQLRRMATNNLRSRFGLISYGGMRVEAQCRAGKLATELTLDDGRVVDPAARYRVATLDFLARGGDGALSGPTQHGPPLGVVREVLERSLHAHGGELRAKDGLFDPTRRRVRLPGPRPLRCRDAQGREEPDEPPIEAAETRPAKPGAQPAASSARP